MTDPTIELDHVSKRYWKIRERSLLRSLIPLGPPNRTELWALRDIDLRISKGETVGIIGRNGAGKSTLLRLLAGVSQPTRGVVTIKGRIAPLLSVGVGFHHEMTGRENVYVNGMLLGLKRPAITRLFDNIVSFAGLADFIDTPVKFYSTGMFMRLGFTVAMHVQPDVLLVDEVLAVGDIGFQLRCLNKMRELQSAGTTIVFVSHALHAVHLLCPRTVLVDAGQIECDGPTEGTIARYHQLMAAGDRTGDGAPVTVLSRALLLPDGTVVDSVDHGQTLTYRSQVRFEQSLDGPGVIFRVLGEDGALAYSMQTPIGEHWRSYRPGDEATIAVDFRPRFGGGGTFHINLDIIDTESVTVVSDTNGPSFYVPPRLGVTGPADLEATITVDGEGRTNHRWARLSADTPVPPVPKA